jgi:hypothetical protein
VKQINFQNLRNLPLERLVADALGELERLGYSRRSRNRYRAIWDHLIEYSHRNELGNEFSEDLALRFLEEHGVGEQTEMPGQRWRKHIAWDVRVLVDLLKTAASSEHSRMWGRSILFPPWRIHFVTTYSTVRIAFSFERGPFMDVRQNSRSSWIFSIQGRSNSIPGSFRVHL